MSRLPLKRLADDLAPVRGRHGARAARSWRRSIRRRRWSRSASPRTSCARLAVLLDLGLGYLSLERSTPTLSPGELQRLRLATQVRSNLFGVVYVLDEPSAGLHPADTEALLRALDRLKAAGNSLFVVEHELDVIRHADWIVDVGPGRRRARRPRALQRPAGGTRAASRRRRRARYLFATSRAPRARRRARRRAGCGSPASRATTCTTSTSRFPLGVFTTRHRRLRARASRAWSARRWSSWSREHLGHELAADEDEGEELERAAPSPTRRPDRRRAWSAIKRLVRVDQKPIGRTPRSNLATYTGLFDHVRKLFAATQGGARARATTPGASRSTSPRAAARPARAKAS